MQALSLPAIIHLITMPVYLGAGITALVRKSVRQRAKNWLAVYLLVAALSATMQMVSAWGLLPAMFGQHTAVYSVPILGLLLVYLTHTFLRIEKDVSIVWIGVTVTAFLMALLLHVNPFGLPDVLGRMAGRVFPRTSVAVGVLVIGWLLVMGQTAVFIIQQYRQTTRQPLHRNRVIYWALVWVLLMVADSFAFNQSASLSPLLHVIATSLAVYAMLVDDLKDIRLFLRRGAAYTIAISIVLLVYTASLSFASNYFTVDQLYLNVFMVLGLAILFYPIRKTAQTVVERLSGDTQYDANETLRDYSSRISNIVDLGQLEMTIMGFISEVLEISHGTFYLVNIEKFSATQKIYQLHSVFGFAEGESLVLGSFEPDSLVATYLAEENKPLAQYDIDLSPRFSGVSAGEREWLKGMGIDMFVPIHGKGEWLGLLGLGSKRTGDRYFDRDLLLLSTFADQTAVALENARLFADQNRLNHDLQNAYKELEEANVELQESDKLKSAFIGVITHEMRTPFANIIFSLNLLDRYGLDNLTPEQKEEVESVKKGVNKAKSMVDDVVMFASFLSKQGEIQTREANFYEVIDKTLDTLRPLAENKGLTLISPPPPEPIIFDADPERLGDAIHHLVHNAVKFTDKGGTVDVRAWVDERFICFAVQDTGRGIPPERLNSLWEGFAQMSDSLKRGLEGLGLGLALVREVVQAHGGEVDATSEVGVGSVFGFRIPRR